MRFLKLMRSGRRSWSKKLAGNEQMINVIRKETPFLLKCIKSMLGNHKGFMKEKFYSC